MLKVIDIVPDTIVDGPRMRTAIYLSGCFHGCRGCHNPSSWVITNGKSMEIDQILAEVTEAGHKRVTISGGDGLCYQVPETLRLVQELREKIPGINIWLYTGYTWEELMEDPERRPILDYLDVLVDGRFQQENYSKDCLFRGSTNQRLILVPESLEKGEILLWEDSMKT